MLRSVGNVQNHIDILQSNIQPTNTPEDYPLNLSSPAEIVINYQARPTFYLLSGIVHLFFKMVTCTRLVTLLAFTTAVLANWIHPKRAFMVAFNDPGDTDDVINKRRADFREIYDHDDWWQKKSGYNIFRNEGKVSWLESSGKNGEYREAFERLRNLGYWRSDTDAGAIWLPSRPF